MLHPPNHKQATRQLALLRLLSTGGFHSGTDLSRLLACSRASVWQDIQAWQARGFAIFAVKGKGYALPKTRLAQISWLDATQLSQNLAACNTPYSVHIEPTLASTNSYLLERSYTLAHPSVLATEWQTAGRGRRGNTWLSLPHDSLTFSVYWHFNRPLSALGGLSLVVGLAIQRALHALGATGVQLKWPNDLLLNQAKLGGLLIETQGDVSQACRVVIGIGINIQPPPAHSALTQATIGLAQEYPTLSRQDILTACLHHLARTLQSFEQTGFAPLQQSWNAAHAFHQKNIQLLVADTAYQTGKVLGIAADGALRLETKDGERQYHIGEISLRGSDVATD